MKAATTVISISAALIASGAAAQDVNLNGPYQCLKACAAAAPGQFAFVTQYGRELNVVNEAGIGSRAWIDYPGRIWVERAHEGAIYSPDGTTIQFDSGTLWHRTPPPPLLLRVRRR